MGRLDWEVRSFFHFAQKKTAFPSLDVERRHKKGMYYEAKVVIFLE